MEKERGKETEISSLSAAVNRKVYISVYVYLYPENGSHDADGNVDLTREEGDAQAGRKKDQGGELESPEHVNVQVKETQLGTQYRSGFKVVHGNNATSFEQFRKFDPWATLSEDQKLEEHRRKFHAQVGCLTPVKYRVVCSKLW